MNNNKKLSIVHPTCNPNVRNAALSFLEAGLLHEVITTFGYNSNSNFMGKLPQPVSRQIEKILSGRVWHLNSECNLRLHPIREMFRLFNAKTKKGIGFGINPNSLTNWIYKSLDEHVAKYHLNNISAVYCYEDGAASTFIKAKEEGILCFYDLPIMFYQKVNSILSEEAELFPQYASAVQSVSEPKWKLDRKKTEIELADHIFVASSITKNSLVETGTPPEKVSIVPYGAPLEYYDYKEKDDDVFRVLFIGRVGPRKGVHYLLSAWEKLNIPKSELLIIGLNEFPDGVLEKYSDRIKYIPYVPHSELNKYYNSADVFILPSLVEGFGLVILEAMTCGIPVIATNNTAAPDIIDNGKDGFIIPIRDIDEICQKIEWFYLNTDEHEKMKVNARQKAEKFTWSIYRKNLSKELMKIYK